MGTRTQVTAIALAIAVFGTVSVARGDAAAQNFAEYCQDELPADRKAKFFAALDATERELAAGNRPAAEAALRDVWRAAFRGGGETDVGVRCQGEQATRRWFNARLELWRRGSTAGMTGGWGADYTTLYAVAADRGADGIVAVVSNRPGKDFAWAYQSVEDIVEVDEWMREYGTLILPEESRIVAAARDALPELRAYAKREHAAALSAEDEAFNRPPTQMELDAMARIGNMGELAESIAGVDMGTMNEQQALVTRRQVDESRELLEKVRGLEVEAVFGYSDERKPSELRAEQRGDILLKRGHDESLSLEYREELYELSGRYYAWCNCRDKVAVAAEAKEAIQPALQAEREERDRKIEKMQAEMQQQAEEMQKSIDDMQKTDAEKKSFNEEADALEAELDF